MNYNKGDRVGDYEIVDILGAGGMGRVYKVRNIISERIEAMKVLLPNLESDPDLADRFMREIKVQASLQHPNIACLHTALRVNNQLLMLIEFVEGSTIEAELRRGPIAVAKAVEYVRQVLLALAHAHKHGVVHRDIKPANVMVMPDGAVKLMDFGIARLSADRKLTQTGRTVGSLYYMSPEQIQGALDLDARSDLYSLGVTLYEMVTARRPFQGDSDYSIMAAHLSSRPMPPIEVDPSLPTALNDVILMAIAKEPAQRFQSADAFRGALNSVAAVPVVPQPTHKPVSGPEKVTPAATPPLVVAPSPGQTKSGSHRGLYMALGSVATVIVLALAAMQAPGLFKRPNAAAPVAQQEPVVTAPPVEKQQPSPEPVQTAPLTPQSPSGTPPSRIAQGPAGSQAAMQRPGLTRPASGSPTPNPGTATEPTTPPNVPVPQPVVQQLPASPSQQATAPPAMPDMSPQREMVMVLGTRANSLKSSLVTIKQQQARMGVNLRADISTAEQRMEFYLDDAAAAVKDGDPGRAKKSLESAERAIETIEKFLGR